MDKGKMEVFPAKVRRLWNKWELRVLVVISLSIQIFLIIFGSQRKRTVSKLINVSLWFGYLSADWAATLALGVLCNSQNDDCDNIPQDQNDSDNDLLAFWAPFLLLHLGGPDSITAFSLEDNQLWLRHLFGLLFQVGVAFYIFIRSLPNTRLWVATVLMFIGGIIKYGERTCALMTACWDIFKTSMASAPESDPNYAKFMEISHTMNNAGLKARIAWETDCESQFLSSQSNDVDDAIIKDLELTIEAHNFFQTFKRLIADLILTVNDRNRSQSFFMNCTWKQAYEVIEIELGYVYEVLFTKAAVNHSHKGRILRLVTVASILAAFMIFLFTKKKGYLGIDIIITYVLLGGAIALEIYSLARLLLSDWTIISIHKRSPKLSNILFIFVSYFRESHQSKGSNSSPKPIQTKVSKSVFSSFPKLSLTQSRWSNSMAQYNLIDFCLNDQPRIVKKIMELINIKDIFDSYWYRSYKPVDDDIKETIYKDLTERLSNAIDSDSYKHFSTYRGELALAKYGAELDWSVKVDLDESILLWHIATDICYHWDENQKNDAEVVSPKSEGQEQPQAIPNKKQPQAGPKPKGQEQPQAVQPQAEGPDDPKPEGPKDPKPEGQDQPQAGPKPEGQDQPQAGPKPEGQEGQEQTQVDPDKKQQEQPQTDPKPEGQEVQEQTQVDPDKKQQEQPQKDPKPEGKEHPKRQGNEQPQAHHDQRMSKLVSDYMLYLLVSRPFMLAAEIGQIKFGQTCAAAEKFYYGEKDKDWDKRDKTSTRKQLCLFFTKDTSGKEAEGDKSKGMLFDACRLANFLLKTDDRWTIISQVWLEMFYYAAIHCKAYYHAQRLSAGGELLTIVWFLMSHLGIGEKYRGHARAKLIVDK